VSAAARRTGQSATSRVTRETLDTSKVVTSTQKTRVYRVVNNADGIRHDLLSPTRPQRVQQPR
jgi:hypothetical protein